MTESIEGTRHIYRIDPRGIGAMRDWLDLYLGDALEAFKAYAEAQGEQSE